MPQPLGTASRVYDAFVEPELDTSRWAFLEYPMPDGSSWRCAEPHARVEIADGTLSVRVEKFELSHDQVQIIDNPKFLILSTESFPLPPESAVTFSVQMSAVGLAGERHDFRDGVAAFNVLDMQTGFVFDVAANSDHVWAIHEMLPVPTAAAPPFTNMIENPFIPVKPSAGAPMLCQVTIDTAQSTVTWLVGGHVITSARPDRLPSQVQLGVGLFTLHPLADGRSQSLRGQGMRATWSQVAVGVARS